MEIQPDDYYLTGELAGHWKIKPNTLEYWRVTRRYPSLRYRRIGGAVRYKGSDILAFENQNPREVKAGAGSYFPKKPQISKPRPRRKPGARRARRA